MANTTTTTTTTRLLLSCLVAALQFTTVSAAAMATATRTAVIPLDAQSPRPTEAPIMFDLARRQNSFTYLVAPDNTCGWVSGNTDACISSGQSCNASCSSDGRILKCTETALPYCHELFLGSSGIFRSFSCGSTSREKPSVYLTIKPGTVRFFATSTSLATIRTTTSTSNGAVVTKIVSVTPSGSTNGGTGEAEENSGGAENGQPSSSVGGGGGGGGGSGGEQPSNGANTGAIVGGAVGGAAVLAIAALAAALLYRRSGKKKSEADGASAAPHGAGYYPMSPSQPDSAAFMPSSYNTPGITWVQHNGHSVSSVSPVPTSPPNAPRYDGGHPKDPTPTAEADGTRLNMVHEMGTN